MSIQTFSTKANLYIYSGSAFALVPSVIKIDPSGLSRGVRKTTNMDSAVGGFEEFAPGILSNPGTLAVEIYRNDTNAIHAMIRNRFNSGSALIDVWKISQEDGTNFTSSGSLMSYDTSFDNLDSNNTVTANFKVQLTGAPIWS